MTELWVIGAAKFAVDVSGFLGAGLGQGGEAYELKGYLAVDGEEAATDPARTGPFDPEVLRTGKVVVAVSDPRVRARLFAEHLEALRRAAVDVVHPTTILAPGARIGRGNIIGPQSYIGSNSVIGDLNVLNYQIGFGHHSQLGDCNFVAPGFQCGNTVNIGNGNFFGLSCTVGPGVTIRDNNRFQAGAIVTQSIASDLLCYSSERLKAVKLPGEEENVAR
jgi:acetyltransferase-like isoleucine patch superfamily enzyme